MSLKTISCKKCNRVLFETEVREGSGWCPKCKTETPFKNMMSKADKTEKMRAAKAARPTSNLTRDFLDDWYWVELAQKSNLRLPQWNTEATKSKMITWAHKLNIPIATYQKEVGMFQQIIDDNPTWPLRALVGLMLEWRENRGDGEGAVVVVATPKPQPPSSYSVVKPLRRQCASASV